MFEYKSRTSFRLATPEGERIVSPGEALRLSSLKAATGVRQGVLIESNVSGLHDIQQTCETRERLLIDRLQLAPVRAGRKSMNLGISLLFRHESLKTHTQPSPEFLAEVEEFNRTASGTNPVAKIQSDTGAGEWGGYRCNIGTGCSHGCLYCFAEGNATRYNQVDGADEWRQERLRKVNSSRCRKYPKPIMSPTSHDITPGYLSTYRCHLHNILSAGNIVIIVTKPHMESIKSICSEFSSFRDNMIFRFTIGGLDNEALKVWEPGAPSLQERLSCLDYAFSMGFRTSISAEPMLVKCEEAEKLYYEVEPLVTENIWFGKMKNVAGFKKHENPEVARRAAELAEVYKDVNILKFVERMSGLPKVEWKDSIKKVINKHAGKQNNAKEK